MAISDSSPLERITVNLIPRAARSLRLAMELTGNSQTDTVNRALQEHAWLEYARSQGGILLYREHEGADLMRVVIPDLPGPVLDEVSRMLSGTATATHQKSPRRPGRA